MVSTHGQGRRQGCSPVCSGMEPRLAATSGDRQGVQEADAVAFSGDEESPEGSTSVSPKPAHFDEDPKMTKKVALTPDGSRSFTIGARLTHK